MSRRKKKTTFKPKVSKSRSLQWKCKGRSRLKAVRLEFEDRYSFNWPQTRERAHQMAGGRCCYCHAQGKRPQVADVVHHARYKDKLGAIAGREQPGVDVFPVCHDCHNLLHHPSRWYKDRGNPKLNNRNYASVRKELIKGWELLSQAKKV